MMNGLPVRVTTEGFLKSVIGVMTLVLETVPLVSTGTLFGAPCFTKFVVFKLDCRISVNSMYFQAKWKNRPTDLDLLSFLNRIYTD